MIFKTEARTEGTPAIQVRDRTPITYEVSVHDARGTQAHLVCTRDELRRMAQAIADRLGEDFKHLRLEARETESAASGRGRGA
jgi:hypothetical protein